VTYLPLGLKVIAFWAAMHCAAIIGEIRGLKAPASYYLYAAIPAVVAVASAGAGMYLTKRQPKQSADLDLIGELSKFYALNGDEKGLAIVSTLVVHTQEGRSANP
jgi:hypothetical protein